MADETADANTNEGQSADASPTPLRLERTPLRGKRDKWPIPVLLLGSLLLVSGLGMWIRSTPGPDFGGAFRDIEARLDRQEYADALDRLNTVIRPEISESTPPSVRGEFHALRGDALYLELNDEGLQSRENFQRVLDDYAEAERWSATAMTPRRRAYRADTLIDLDRRAEAEPIILGLPDEEASWRHTLLRRLVDDAMSGQRPDEDQARRLLAIFRRDSELPVEERLWASARQAELRIIGGRPEAAIDQLLTEAQRIGDRTDPRLAETYLLLARAYLNLGQTETAKQHLERASSILPSTDPLRGPVDVTLARIEQFLGETELARDSLRVVVGRFRDPSTLLPAFTYLGEVEGDLGNPEASVAAYARAVELLPEREARSEVTPDLLAESIARRHRKHFELGDYKTALALAEIAERVYPADAVPPDVIQRLGDTHLALAESLIQQEVGDQDLAELDVRDVDPVTLEEARVHFFQTGEAYRRYARDVIVGNAEASYDALWNAADAFDRAGDQELAIELFTEFAQARPEDPRFLLAKLRLAQAFHAIGDYTGAIPLYEELIRDNPTSEEAYRASVPLAQCYLLASDDRDAERAERRLLDVIRGGRFAPDSVQYRDALVELGRLYRRTGRHVPAIERLTEATERYKNLADELGVRMDLADSNRLSAAEIEDRLKEAMPRAESQRLTELREERLRNAMSIYEDVRAAMEAIDSRRRTDLQNAYLRNALLYRADCAFDLGDYERAITYYDTAAQQYRDDPASLVALVQIVSCYWRLEKPREARTAHQRAQVRLSELPEEAWSSDNSPMDRRHWERWLDVSFRLDAGEETAEAAP